MLEAVDDHIVPGPASADLAWRRREFSLARVSGT